MNTNNRDEKIGEWAAIGHMVLDGFWPVGAAYGTQVLNLPPIELLGLATFFSSFFFISLTLKKGELYQLFDRRFIKGCFLYSACLLLPYAAIFYAVKTNSAMNTAILTQSEVVFAALIGWLFLKEEVKLFRLLGISCILAANIIVLYNGGIEMNPASLILILAPVVFVFGNAVAKRLQAKGLGYSPLLLFRGAVGGSGLLLLSTLLEDIQIPKSSNWLFLLAFGILAFGIPKALWQIALNKIDLSKTTAIGLSYPAFSFIMAYFLLKEVPSIYQGIGLGLSFLGIFLLTKTKSKGLTKLGVPLS